MPHQSPSGGSLWGHCRAPYTHIHNYKQCIIVKPGGEETDMEMERTCKTSHSNPSSGWLWAERRKQLSMGAGWQICISWLNRCLELTVTLRCSSAVTWCADNKQLLWRSQAGISYASVTHLVSETEALLPSLFKRQDISPQSLWQLETGFKTCPKFTLQFASLEKSVRSLTALHISQCLWVWKQTHITHLIKFSAAIFAQTDYWTRAATVQDCWTGRG